MTGYWPRPAVLERIPQQGHVVIEASAGTGKTYTLEHLVIDLVLREGLPLERILVVTFTEKAAAELATRLRTAMTRILTGPWPADDGWRIDAAARARLRRGLTAFDAASISTIHAFCHRILSEYAFVNGRLFHEELVDGRAAFQEAFVGGVRRTLATDPTCEPYLTAWLQRSPLDALADRLFDAHTRRGVIHPAYDPQGLLSALRILTRLELTPTVLRPTLQRARMASATAQAVLNRVKALRTILEAFHADENLADALSALEQEDQARRRDGGLFGYLLDVLPPVAGESPRLAELVQALTRLEEVRVPLESAAVQVALPVVQERLREEKRAAARFDFDDMLRLVDEALAGPAGDSLIAALRRRFRVVLIDEFQDTDEVQWSVFRQVFAESPDHRLVVIGDPKQAIYGFRGADVMTYLQARGHLGRSGAPTIPLTDSYRARPPLIAALDRLLDQTALDPFFTGAIRYDHPVRAEGEVPELTMAGQPTSAVHVFELVPKKDTLSPSSARRTLDHRIAEEIDALLAHGRLVGRGEDRPLSAADIFVLTRTVQEGLAVASALRTQGIPHAFYKQDGLFQTAEANDVRDLLSAIAEPHDRSRRIRAWLGPFYAVPLDEARQCLDLPGSHPLLSSLFRFRGLAEDKRWARLFSAILDETGLIEREVLLADSERELTNFLHIFEVLLDEALRARGTLADLLHTMSAFIERRQAPQGEDGNVQRVASEEAAVQIMTCHKAKGLEAPVVFLTGGLDRNPGFAHVYHADGERRLHLGHPAPLAAEQERDEEDQRLAYVALTRAKCRLYLPFYGGRSAPVLTALTGTYRPIDLALERLVRAPQEPSIGPHPSGTVITTEPVAERAARRPRAAGPGRPALRAVRWPPADEPAPTTPLKRAHWGRLITSYSRLKEAQGRFHPTPAREEAQTHPLQDTDRLSGPEIPPDELPGGTASGRFIHEMLELVDLQVVRRQAGWAFWATREDVQAIFQRGLRRYDRRPEHLPYSYRLVFEALTTPLTLGDVKLTDGVAGADRVLREMEFLYPAARERIKGVKGYVKGFIDAVIEHHKKVLVLDWKTDLLPDYRASLTPHVEANYGLQADLYTVALLKQLGIADPDAYDARFGGTVYLFVRGLASDGAGVYFARPSWGAIQAAANRLATMDLTDGRWRDE